MKLGMIGGILKSRKARGCSRKLALEIATEAEITVSIEKSINKKRLAQGAVATMCTYAVKTGTFHQHHKTLYRLR